MAAETFGGLLQRLRHQARLTQEGLAERALMSTRAVSDLERGVSRSARNHTAHLLADALDLAVDERERFLDAATGRPPPSSTDERDGQRLDLPEEAGSFPRPSTPIFGRDDDIALAERWITEEGVKFVALVGPGGVGKTRLAIELGRRLTPQFDDGGSFVALAGLVDPALVPVAVADALGVSPGADGATVAVRDHLRSRRFVLVLDNLEHLHNVESFAADLVADANRLVIIATSRTPAGTEGIRQFPVRALTEEPAVQLFVERARAVRTAWHPTSADLDTVAALCLRLDSLPLAIELAAARSALVSPRGLLDRLEQRLDVLSTGPPTAPDRQRTLRGVMAWSHDLLEPAAQGLFVRLALFRGGFTAAAAERLGGHEASVTFDALDALVASGLITATEGVDGEPRLVMLETVRPFALERLVAGGDELRLRDLHLQWAADLAAAAEGRLTGPTQPAWLKALAADHDNLRAALTWALDQRRVGAAIHLAAGLWRFWYLRGHLAEGRTWCEQVLELPVAELGREVLAARARVEYGTGILAWLGGDPGAAQARAASAEAQLRELGEEATSAHAANLIGMIAQYRGDDAVAEAAFTNALAVGERLNDARAMAVSHINLGTLLTERGEFVEATGHLEDSLTLFNELGDHRSAADVLNSLGDLAGRQGLLDIAVELCRRSLEQFTSLEDPAGQSEAHQHLAALARRQRRPADAAEHLRVVLDLSETTGDPWGRAAAFTSLAELAADDDDELEAGRLLRQGLHIHRRLEHRQGVADALRGLAQLARRRGDHDQADALERDAALAINA